MRSVLAIDGSKSAEVALDLAASLEWPSGSSVRVVIALEPVDASVVGGWAPGVAFDLDRQDNELVEASDRILEQAAQRLTLTGLDVGSAVLEGRPASTIVEDAAAFGAELLMIGSRGHGEIASMVLGSVSAEVADHAPCPVLVARRPQLARVILAADGSDYALAAEELMTHQSWMFSRAEIQVVTVARTDVAWRSGIAVAGYVPEPAEQGDPTHQIVAEHQQVAERAAARLARAGLRATPRVIEGDAATELIRVARESQADLIVLGTHGRTGISRLLLGSVARNVMVHAGCSVLIVRSRPAHSAT